MGNEPLLVGDLILCEILQGCALRGPGTNAGGGVAQFDVVPMLNPELAIVAAKNYRLLRSEGITNPQKPSISSSALFASFTDTRSCTTIATLAPWRLIWASKTTVKELPST